MQFLIIEDDPDDREIFRLVVSTANVPVQCVFSCDCYASVRYLLDNKECVPNFIFLDLFLTDMDGRKCIEMLRKISKLSDTQFVIFSGFALPDSMEQEMKVYKYKYLQKSASITRMAFELEILLANNP